MRTESEIRAEMREIEEDARMYYRTATVRENAPLALVQMSQETKHQVLSWILEEAPVDWTQRRWSKSQDRE